MMEGKGGGLFPTYSFLQQSTHDDHQPLLMKRCRENIEQPPLTQGPASTLSQSSAKYPFLSDGQWYSHQSAHQSEHLHSENSLQSRQTFMRLPELIDTLAKDERVLFWDAVHNWFEVVDGPLFEERFNALRCIRGKRREDAVDRPFARMHIHFTLVRGDKWAGTGSAFRPKGESIFRSNGQAHATSCSTAPNPVRQTSANLCDQLADMKREQASGLIFTTAMPPDKRWRPAGQTAEASTGMRDEFKPFDDPGSCQMYDIPSLWEAQLEVRRYPRARTAALLAPPLQPATAL
jgi:hypothetical protein